MSFAKDSKLQIIEKDIEDADCGLAFLSGLIHASGTIIKNNEGMRPDIITDFKEIFSFVNYYLPLFDISFPQKEMWNRGFYLQTQ